MNFKISKILSRYGGHQNLCKFIKRRKNPAAHQQISYSLEFLEEETFLTASKIE